MSSWLLGVVHPYTLGIFIHILLVVAIVVLLIRAIQGRSATVKQCSTLQAGLFASPARDFAPQHTKIAGNVYPANRLGWLQT